MDYNRVLAQRALDAKQPTQLMGASGFFSRPTPGLDPRLFPATSDRVHPEVRRYILHTLYGFWGHLYLHPHQWSTVWMAGSGITYQWSGQREVGTPGDLDVLIGVEWDEFFWSNPSFRGMSNVDMAEQMDEELSSQLWPRTANVFFHTGGGTPFAQGVAPVPGAGLRSITPEGSVPSASPGTTGISTSGGSTGSHSPSTKSFWQRNLASAPSAGVPTAADDTGSSSSTTAIQPGAFAASSVGGATTLSGSSATTSQGLSDYSHMSGGTFEVTFYVNATGTDIRDIHPYAAYDLTDDQWTVRPPALSEDWDPRRDLEHDWWTSIDQDTSKAHELLNNFHHQRDLLGLHTAGSGEWTNAVTSLHSSMREAHVLFDDIHTGRRAAFGPDGQGYADYNNVRWQAGKQSGAVQALHSLAALDSLVHSDYEQNCYGGAVLDPHHAYATAQRAVAAGI
jgi:hypothetical protein